MSLLYCRCAALIDTDEDPEGAEDGRCEACRQWTAEDEAALQSDIERADRKAEC